MDTSSQPNETLQDFPWFAATGSISGEFSITPGRAFHGRSQRTPNDCMQPREAFVLGPLDISFEKLKRELQDALIEDLGSGTQFLRWAGTSGEYVILVHDLDDSPEIIDIYDGIEVSQQYITISAKGLRRFTTSSDQSWDPVPWNSTHPTVRIWGTPHGRSWLVLGVAGLSHSW